MRRSRAFILSEQLLTIMLQAGFILTLCMSFYLLLSFYGRTQQVLSARNHAERVISFMDDKIRHAGLGLWKCSSPETIGTRLGDILMLSWTGNNSNAYRLPISLKWHSDGVPSTTGDIPLKARNQDSGDVITVLYAQRDLSSGEDNEIISAFSATVTLKPEPNNAARLTGNARLLDSSSANRLRNNSIFTVGGVAGNIKSYAVMEGVGMPLCLYSSSGSNLTVKMLHMDTASETIPAGGELLGLECMQMFVDNRTAGEGGQLVYRTLQSGGTAWDKNYNQEKGILDIYMRLDPDNNTFTLWVLATGGYDVDATNPRPESWPDSATWTEEYSHHTVYVSRATWKLNNIPPNFTW